MSFSFVLADFTINNSLTGIVLPNTQTQYTTLVTEHNLAIVLYCTVAWHLVTGRGRVSQTTWKQPINVVCCGPRIVVGLAGPIGEWLTHPAGRQHILSARSRGPSVKHATVISPLAFALRHANYL